MLEIIWLFFKFALIVNIGQAIGICMWLILSRLGFDEDFIWEDE